jgi:hypothetical protein
MRSISTVPNLIFAVTDFHDVLVLKVTEQAQHQDFIKVTTALNEVEPNEHREFHHKEYFEKLYFNLDGSPRKSCIFSDLCRGKAFAEKNIREEINLKKREIHILEEQAFKIVSL